MIIDLLSLFPEMLDGVLRTSIVARAQKNQLLHCRPHNLRHWSTRKHRRVDDRPFGGGAGMVIQPEPLAQAIRDLKTEQAFVIYLCPDGTPFTTAIAQQLAQKSHLIFVSGHYEGIDQRIRDKYIDWEISIGDYVLTNGTLAAAVVIDAICRHIPGVLGNAVSLEQDSFSDGLLSPPQYTQPRVFEGMEVPEVLLSGDHAAIDRWRQRQRLERTRQRRPDLLNG
ncbi:MAG: tRNA (guanosine(37)-N1)-methyltransferase TrmD [Puniceicoccales bacterium]|jgi:tRNA (guanine37-N1)-methyltransferase|nr:tRNA (guanosine(37)-N1)-methyltransferase TrmD [Puniceicoccales bacterium]